MKSLSSVTLALTCTLSPHAGAASAELGRQVAVEHCRRCHVIPGENNMGIGSTPSFTIMVKADREDWRHRFEAFYALRPHPSFVVIREFRTQPEYPLGIQPVILSLQDIEHLMAYIDALAETYRK